MAKPSTYRDFMKALKRHWRSVLPEVRPLTEARGSLAKASSFYAGFLPMARLHVYLEFQTHSNIAGRFTINVILTHDEAAPRQWHASDEQRVLGRFIEGPNRIGLFLKARHGDKWWELCRDEKMEGFRLEHGLARNEDYWYPQDWSDEVGVIRDAVDDVTRGVQLALQQLNYLESNDRQRGA